MMYYLFNPYRDYIFHSNRTSLISCLKKYPAYRFKKLVGLIELTNHLLISE